MCEERKNVHQRKFLFSEDSISFDQIRFPAYRNVTSGTCWSRSTVRAVVDSEAEPRDPVTGRRWIVPPIRWDVDEVVRLMNDVRTGVSHYKIIHFDEFLR